MGGLLRATAAIAGVVLTLGLSPVPANAADSAPPVVFIVDASGSMVRESSPGTTRMDAAKRALKTTLSALPSGTDAGLLVFGTGTGNTDAEQAAGCQDVKTLAGLGAVDTAALGAKIDGIAASGFTPISEALRQAFAMLPADRESNIVLISDGVDTCAPPASCEVAAQLHADHPSVSINVVAFGVDGDEAASQQMTCIGRVGGGVSSSASDTTQLTAQLRAASSDRTALSTAGMNGVRLGMTLAEVRHLVDGAVVSGPTSVDGVEIVYVDCVWGRIELRDGRVYAITPQDATVATADGIAPGAPLADVEALYGPPVDTTTDADGTSNVYRLRRGSDAGYRVYLDSGRTVKRIILCRCAKASALSAAPSDWEITFDGVGPLQLGMTVDEAYQAMPTLASRTAQTVYYLTDAGGGEWLTVTFTDGRLSTLRVQDPRATGTKVSADAAHYPSISGMRLGASMPTVISAYAGGMYERVNAAGINDYVVTDREGRALSFHAAGGSSSGSGIDVSGYIRTGYLDSITLEDATLTRVANEVPQTVTEPSAPSPITGLPAELSGTWCSTSGGQCVSFDELAQKYPGAFVENSGASTTPGATAYRVCLQDDLGGGSCSNAASMNLEYFPVGVAWNCVADGAKQWSFTRCDPDYTSRHDTTKARLVTRPNHQGETAYSDSEPMYRTG